MIRVGQVVGVFGIRGAVKVRSLTDFDDRFETDAQLYLDGVARKVEWSRDQAGSLVVKLRGIDTRNDAESWRGSYLEVPDTDVRPLPDDEWYHDQLLGLRVVTDDGRELGTIEEIMERPANDVWVIRGDGGETLIPAIRDAVSTVDLEGGRVTVGGWLLDVEDA
jgi:16S rRNA processing protein RimM